MQELLLVNRGASSPSPRGNNTALAFACIAAMGSSSYYLYYHALRRRPQKPQEEEGSEYSPPFIRGLPYFGCVYDFVSRPVEFITGAERHCGDVFGFTLMGKNVIMLTNPGDFDRVWRMSDRYLTTIDNAFKNVMMLSQSRYEWFMSNQCNKTIHHCLVQGLQGAKLGALNCIVAETLEQQLKCHANGARKLYDWTSRILYEVITTTMGGKEFHDKIRYEDYLDLDAGFHLIVSGFAPPFSSLLSNARAAQRRLGATLLACVGKPDNSSLLKDLSLKFIAMHLTNSEQELLLGALTWAIHANTSAIVFWLLIYLMNNEDAMNAVNTELSAYAEQHPNWWKETSNIVEHLGNLRTLKSASVETLRLLTATLGSRDCVQDVDIALTNGKTLKLERGDRVFMYPTWHHFDSVFPRADEFRYDRFLHPEEPFFLHGEPLRDPVVSFGGGATKCPGQMLAQSEILLFTAILLTRFDIKLIKATSKVPAFNLLKFGLGSFAPANDVSFDLKAKEMK